MKKALFIAALLASTQAHALTGYLKSQSVSGQNRYCYYSNGAIITVQSYKLCPMSAG